MTTTPSRRSWFTAGRVRSRARSASCCHGRVADFGGLPIHGVCPEFGLLDPALFPPDKTAELSRFAISKDFRRRAEDGLYGAFVDDDGLRHEWRRVIPHISLGLISAALRFGSQHGMEVACAVMEPPLLRLLTRFGVHFTPLGPIVEYHGRRQPCYARGESLIARVARERPDVWDVITDGGRYWPATAPSAACVGHEAAELA